MMDAFSDSLYEFLRRAGCEEKQIAGLSLDTDLRTDLKLDGDNLIDTLEILPEKFAVDMSAFVYERYGRAEGELLGLVRPMHILLHRLLPHHFKHPDVGLKPITLELIQRALLAHRWIDD